MRVRDVFNHVVFPAIFVMAFGIAPVMAQGTAPVADAGLDRTVPFDGVSPVIVVLDGTGTIDGDGQQLTDDDPATPYGITWSIVSKPAGSGAILSDDQAIRPTFQIDAAGDYVIQLTANDGTTISTDTVTVSTENSTPHADAGRDRKVALNDTVVLDGSGSTDWDGDSLTYGWTVTAPDSSAVTLSDPNSVMPSFLVEQVGDYTATLTVSDGARTSEADQVLLTTANVPPVAVANAGQDVAIPTGLFLNSLDAEGTSDPDGDTLTYRWSLLWGPSGGGYSLGDETQRRGSMSTINATGDWVVQLTVGDGTFTRHTTFLLASTTNIAPTANAGTDQAIAVGQTVTLDGTGSVDNSRNEIVSYHWALVHKPAVSSAALDDPDAARPRFTADLPGTYIAQLIVNDGITDSVPDTVVISTDANLTPVADAGIDYFQQGLGNTIQLDGTGSADPNGDALTYRWIMLERAVRSSAVLSDPTSPSPTFVADKTGIYVIQLVVSDGVTESAPDIVMVSAKGQGGTVDVNLRPIADGGAAVLQTGPGLVQLDGSGSVNPNDPNPINLTYRWSLVHKPAGSNATLSDPTLISPTFTTDVAGLYVAQLMVFDGVFWSIADTTVTRLNAPPVAAAGPDQTGFVDQAVTLDGSASGDPDGDPLTFSWSFASTPPGSAATLSDATTATPSFTPDVFGDYVVALTVDDGTVSSMPDSVTVSMVNRAPVAEAGAEQSVTAGALVQLDGSASSDVDHQPLTYAWRFTAKPAGSLAALSDASAVSPTFTADVEGLYVLDLVVNDGIVDSQPDTVGVHAGSAVANTAPVLDPVGPQTVELGSTLTLTLRASDADGDPLSFFATPLPLPVGAGLDAATGAFSFRPDETQVGVHTISFGVGDGLASDSESVQIMVSAPPAGTATTLTGQLRDAVSNAGGLTVPVSGATVTIVGSGVTATTDAQGNFSLTPVPAGGQLLGVDGSTAAAAPDGSTYGSARRDVTLIANAVNTLDGAVYLARIDPNGTASYASADPNQTSVENAALGVTLTVEPASATLNGAAFDGTISVSDMPPAEALALLPPFISPCQVVAIEPFGIAFSPPATISLPNPDGLPAAAIADVWALNPATGLFEIVGAGTVSADQSEIVLANGLPWGTMVMALPRAPTAVAAIDMNGFNRTPSLLGDGNMTQALTLPGSQVFGNDVAPTFVYNSTAANPRPVVATEVTFPANTGMPATLEGRLIVGGTEAAGPVFTSTAGDPLATPPLPPLAAGQPIRQALQFSGADLPSGSYSYRYVASSRFACSTVGAAAEGRVIVRNEQASEFGAGWTLAELDRLDVQADGSVVIAGGDGSTLRFAPESIGGFVETATLDTRLKTAVGGTPLQSGVNYTLTVDGTWSEWPKSTWDGGVCNGTAENQPMFPTALVVNDKVGIDAEYIFAAPSGSSVCSATLPGPTAAFQISLNGGVSWIDPVPAESTYDGTDHSYTYQVTGQGFPLRMRINSPVNNTSYGLLRVRTTSTEHVPAAGALVTLESFMVGSRTGGIAGGSAMRLENGRLYTIEVDGTYSEWSATQWTLRGTCEGTSDPLPRYPTKDITNGRVGLDYLYEFAAPGGSGLCTDGNAPPVKIGPLYDVTQDRGASFFKAVPGNDAYSPAHVYSFELLGNGELLQARNSPDLDTDNHGLMRFQIKTDPIASPPGDFSTLVQNADGTYTRTLKDGTVYVFDADGRQTKVVDTNGNETLYAYDPVTGKLASITRPDGTQTVFDYSVNSVLTVTDAAGRETKLVYDAAGNLIWIVNPDGSFRRFDYTDRHQVDAVASARGFVTTHDYGFAGQWIGSGFPDGRSISASISGSLGLSDFDSGLGTEASPDTYVLPEDRISTLRDARGNVYETEVNQFGVLIRVTDPIGRTTRYVRDADNLVRQAIRDNDGLLPDGTVPATVTTALDYDDRGNVISKTEAAGTALERTTRFFYEPAFNKVVKIVDPTNTLPDPACGTAGVTCFEYDAAGNRTKVIDAKGGEQSLTYDAQGRLATSTDANLNLTQFFYGADGNLERVIDGVGSETRFIRDPAGNILFRYEGWGSPEQRVTVATYDEMNRLRTRTDPEGGISINRYDINGNVIEDIDATGIGSTSVYDVMDRLVEDFHPATGTVRRTYDPNGNLATLVDPLGKITHFQYDAVNRAERTEDPAQGVRLFAYDLANNLKLVTDANGVATYFTYDVFGRKIERSNALGNAWTFAYDSRSNLVEMVDAVGQAINKTYDELNRLTRIELIEADGVTVEDTVTFTYDPLGLMRTAVDGDSSLAWSYDGANRVQTAETVAAPGAVQPALVLTHEYDAVGNRKGLTHGPDAVTVDGAWSFVHDGNGSLTQIAMPSSDTIQLFYDAAQRLERIAYPSSAGMTVTYDATTGRPEAISQTQGTTELTRLEYGFDLDGKILSIADAGGTRNFTYDATLQVETGGYAAAPETYSYDAEGNRISSHLSTSYTYDSANRLRDDDDACYNYDANGNLISRTEKVAGACTGAVTAYAWDVLNRLVRIDFPDATYATYRYDPQGRRIEKDANGDVSRYVYDGGSILLEFDGTGALIATYTHGEQIDQPLAVARNGETYFYHADNLGSVRLITGADGTVISRYDYDIFGNLENSSYEGIANPFLFTGREHDAESGFMFYRARYYDPHLGRFISEDPIGLHAGSSNFYRYARNNPVSFIDPLGLVEAVETGVEESEAGAKAGSVGGVGRNLACLFGKIASVTELVADAMDNLGRVKIKPTNCGAVSNELMLEVAEQACKIFARSLSNKEKGSLGEDLVAEVLQEIGGQLLGTQIDWGFDSNGKLRRTVIDSVQKIDNIIAAFEVKFGKYARLTSAQKLGYPDLSKWMPVYQIKFNQDKCDKINR